MATLTTAQKNSLNAASAALGNVATQLKAKQASGQTTVKLTDTVNLGGGSGSNGKKYTSSSNAITQATEALAPTVAEVQKTGQYFSLPQGLTGAPTPVTTNFNANTIGGTTPNITPYVDTTFQYDALANSYIPAPEKTGAEKQLESISENKARRAQELAGFDFSREQRRAEEAQGLPSMRNQLNDLNLQIAQKQGQYSQLLNIAENRAIPTPFIIGEQNEIKKTAAIEIGTLEMTRQAIQGNISQAQATADKIVDAKYKTIISQIQAYDTQLETIKPFLDKEEKKTAQQQQLASKQLEAEIATKKELEKQALQKIIEGISNGAGANAYTKAQQQIAEGDYLGAIATVAPWTKNTVSSGSGTSNQSTDNERALMSQFRGEQIVKDYNEILSNKGTIDSYIQNGVGGPSDLALVFSFMKGLDPNSVVRETEYATAAKSGNIFAGAFSKFNGYFKEKGGFLPDSVKTEFQNLVNLKLKVKEAQYNNLKEQYSGIAARQGLNPENVIVDYSKGGLSNTKSTSSGNSYSVSSDTPDLLEGVEYEVIQY